MTLSKIGARHPGGRPRVRITPQQVQQLRSQGASWRQLAKVLGIGTATAMRLLQSNDGVCPNIQKMSGGTFGEIAQPSE
jgi:hypothetical protein